MPILTIQKKLRQAGRIRIGAKVATKNGGSRPSKLDAFRFTSPDRYVIEAVADVYGGDVQQWDGGVGDQWEVYAKTTDIEVLVPPADLTLSQYYEAWTGGGCVRRCDGITNILTDSPCVCTPDDRECKPTTRLNVLLAAIEGIGVFRLESHGYNSAAELGGSIDVLKSMQDRFALVPGRLMLEQRQSKKVDPVTGKTERFDYCVPVLDFRVNVAQYQMHPSPTHAALTSGPPVTTIPREDFSTPSIAEQLQAAQEPRVRPTRSNAAATLPRTGVKPRGMSTVAEPDEVIDPPPRTKPEPKADRTPGGASTASVRKLMATVRGNKDVPSDTDEERYEWAAIALDHPVASFNDLSQNEVSRLIDVASGKAPLIPDAPGYANDDPERPF